MSSTPRGIEKRQREAMERAVTVLRVVEDEIPPDNEDLLRDIADALTDLEEALAYTELKE